MNIRIKNILALLPNGKEYKTQVTDVYVSGDSIASVGTAPENFVAEKTVDGSGKLLIPGLCNAHTHAYMNIYRNIADDLKFSDWLFSNIYPMEENTVAEDAYWGNALACMEMLRTGTTVYNDMHVFTNVSPVAASEAGMRAVVSRGLVGEGDNEAGRIRLEAAKAEIEKYKDDPLVTFMLAPHAIYSCDGEYMKTVFKEAKRLGVGIHTHLSESKDEVSNALEKYGMTPVEYFDSVGMFENNTIAAHCVYLTDNDIDILARKGVYVAHNPKSNLKLANGIARIPEMLRRGVKVCIGTDGAASNNSLNMFSEMNFAALIHKGNEHDALAFSSTEVLRSATEIGYLAVGIDAGRIEAGKKADLVIIDLDRPTMHPFNNYISALTYSASGYEVETVIVNGEIVLENGHCTRLDEEKIYFNVEKVAERMRNLK